MLDSHAPAETLAVLTTAPVAIMDAYDALGPVTLQHPAYQAGLRGDTSDAALDVIAGELLDGPAASYDVGTLLVALRRWRTELQVLAAARR